MLQQSKTLNQLIASKIARTLIDEKMLSLRHMRPAAEIIANNIATLQRSVDHEKDLAFLYTIINHAAANELNNNLYAKAASHINNSGDYGRVIQTAEITEAVTNATKDVMTNISDSYIYATLRYFRDKPALIDHTMSILRTNIERNVIEYNARILAQRSKK